MGDLYYKIVVFFGRFPFWVSSRSVVLHRDRAARQGPFILASNHASPYDVPALMRSSPRRLDFVSTTEVFSKKFVAWFYSHMNAFPLNRGKTDPKTVRIILDRLQQGRVVAMFPEGRVRDEKESVVHGAPFRPGVARLARMAGVPIVPAVCWGTGAYTRFASWLPIKRIRYGVIYGEPIAASDEAEAERELALAYKSLYAELRDAMG
jgi:1-acyl-sn-glycerol-3-phosphate acyltransferase